MRYPKATDEEIKQAQEFLKTHHMAVISTVSDHGKPWGAAIYSVCDENFNFYFATREQTSKYKNIDHNSRVALTFANSETQRTVQVSGTISIVPMKEVKEVVFKKLTSIKPSGNIDWTPPVVKVHKGNWMILKIAPEYAQYADYKKSKSHPEESYIKQII